MASLVPELFRTMPITNFLALRDNFPKHDRGVTRVFYVELGLRPAGPLKSRKAMSTYFNRLVALAFGSRTPSRIALGSFSTIPR